MCRTGERLLAGDAVQGTRSKRITKHKNEETKVKVILCEKAAARVNTEIDIERHQTATRSFSDAWTSEESV